jgi:nanoRNase/pAp phosphatase (c-di-AMP/oligoRNAs hydrolase)
MNIVDMIKFLPVHWKVIAANEPDEFFDDGRDYDLPMFIRNDGLARIYFNKDEDESSDCRFAISWDWHSDGDCCGSFERAVSLADEYVKGNPL